MNYKAELEAVKKFKNKYRAAEDKAMDLIVEHKQSPISTKHKEDCITVTFRGFRYVISLDGTANYEMLG